MTTLTNPAQPALNPSQPAAPQPTSLARALIESTVLTTLLLIAILAVSTYTVTLLQYPGLAVAAAVGLLWFFVRWQPAPPTRWANPAQTGTYLLKYAVALGLHASLHLAAPVLIDALGGHSLFVNGFIGSASGAGLFHALISLFALPVLWGLRLVWQGWQRVQHRRLFWSLIHTQFVGAAAITALFAFGLTLWQLTYALRINNLITLDGITGAAVYLLNIALPGLLISLVLATLAFLAIQPLIWLLAFAYTRPASRRITALADAARTLTTGDLTARVPVTGADEIAALQADFNHMAAALETTQTQLRAERDATARLLESKKTLVANVSHELRTPVATLRATLESHLNREAAIPPTDAAGMHADLLRLQALIDDLFTLARTDADALPLDLQPVEVAPVIAATLAALRPIAQQSGSVELLTDLPDDLPPVLADPQRLAQILTNLVRNAIQHTPPGGLVQVAATIDDSALHLTVRDTGPGIPAEHLPHLFERFYQVDEDSRGSGLGLALVKELAEAMHGSITVESTPGHGSAFTFTLPRAA